ncbi:MAG: class I SAM-dependent methyltransferase [Acidobacteria bacterium]|nr:class I SAM-dependent methyltransferase [Acidobacteriota bacterium]
MHRICSLLSITSVLAVSCWSGASCLPQVSSSAADLDTRVRKFLDSRRGTWRDMNVPTSDGQELHNIIVRHTYRSALEIGTSTGHSGIWIAWALSKTGGKLVTIEIDRSRHAEALANFREAGVADYIDARLGDAHVIVPALAGPFDFVFLDADKDWYRNYLEAVLPKLSVGGCFVAHNVSDYGWGYSREFLEYARSLPFLETTVLRSSRSGMSVSYKRAAR